MLTPFGIEVRKLRLKKGTRLLDLARAMGLTSAFISAVETGRKRIPEGYVDKVAAAMKLSVTESERIQRAADRTKPEVRVDDLTGDQRELIAAFARRINEVPVKTREQLKRSVFKSLTSEIPHLRKRHGLLVPPLSAKVIRDFASQTHQGSSLIFG